jgi:hypothetical protein
VFITEVQNVYASSPQKPAPDSETPDESDALKQRKDVKTFQNYVFPGVTSDVTPLPNDIDGDHILDVVFASMTSEPNVRPPFLHLFQRRW